MKKPIKFDYAFFKANPNTELQYSNGDRAYFIGVNTKDTMGENAIFTNNDNGTYTCHCLNGSYYDNSDKSKYDLFMLVEAPEPKVVVCYANIYSVLLWAHSIFH